MVSLNEAARLTGVPYSTLQRWLIAAGVVMGWQGQCRAVPLHEVFEVVAIRRQRRRAYAGALSHQEVS